MQVQNFTVMFVLCLALSPSYAFAQSVMPAYLTLGSGILVLIGLTLYVVKQIRQGIASCLSKPKTKT